MEKKRRRGGEEKLTATKKKEGTLRSLTVRNDQEQKESLDLMYTIIETENRNPVNKDALRQIFPGVLCRFFFAWLYGNPVPAHPIAASTSPSKENWGEGDWKQMRDGWGWGLRFWIVVLYGGACRLVRSE